MEQHKPSEWATKRRYDASIEMEMGQTGTCMAPKRHADPLKLGPVKRMKYNPHGWKSVKFCTDANKTCLVPRNDDDVKNAWMSDNDEATPRKSLLSMLRSSRRNVLNTRDSDTTFRGLEHVVNACYLEEKMLHVHRFRRSILRLQHDVDAIAALSASLSISNVREAESAAVQDAWDARHVLLGHRSVSSEACGASSRAIVSDGEDYCLFSRRKTPRTTVPVLASGHCQQVQFEM